MEALLSLWHDMFARRLEWAEHAYEDFLRKIDPDLAMYFSGKEKEVYVVLYGKTQVGKTTLLLKLMGVNHEVAKTLRGGRGKGRSATVTITRYTASPDDFWRLTSDSHTDATLDDDGIVAELIALRERVEQGGFLSDRPVIIKIPRKHFTSERIHGPKVNILDLPGENASNEAEASHVRAVAQKYVPAADLVLLVGLGDDLSFVKPEALPIPEIGDWRYQPEKFRIITTFTTRAKSYNDFLSSIDNPTKEHFRERLLSELKTFEDFILPDDAKNEFFYPLEFGDSWQELHQSNPELFAKVSDVIDGPDGLFVDLHVDINRSATKYSRIMKAFKTHTYAAKHKVKVLKYYDDNISQLTKNNTNYDIRKNQLSEQCEYLDNKIIELKDEEDRWQEALKTAIVNIGHVIMAEGINNAVNKNRNDLYAYLSSMHQDILLSFDELYSSSEEYVYELLGKVRKSVISETIESEFVQIRSHLNDYLIDSYPADFYTGNFEKDLGRCRTAVQNAIKAVCDLCSKVVSKEAEAIGKSLCAQIDSDTSQAAMYEEITTRLKNKIHDVSQEIEKLQAEKVEFEGRMAASIKLGNKFNLQLSRAFHSEVTERINALAAEKSPVRRFIKLVAAVQMCNEKEKLFANGNG